MTAGEEARKGLRFSHTNRPGFWMGFVDFFTAGVFFLFYMPLGGLQDELDEILGRRTQRYWQAYLLGVPTLFIYPLVWMARIAEELKAKAVALGLEGPYTSWRHMFGWNTVGLPLCGPAVATHRFFDTLNRIERELNNAGRAESAAGASGLPARQRADLRKKAMSAAEAGGFSLILEQAHGRLSRGQTDGEARAMYRFYGWQGADIRDRRGLTPRDYYDLLSGIWAADTCAPRMRGDWTPDNPTLGQCSITAFLMQDCFGGRVLGVPLGDGSFHCFNVVDGCVFDLTSEQFGDRALDYSDCPEQRREAHFAKAEKKARYELLRERLLAALDGGGA